MHKSTILVPSFQSVKLSDGVDIRGRFIISTDFVSREMEMLTAEVERSLDELIPQIKAFQHVPATGEVTLSG